MLIPIYLALSASLAGALTTALLPGAPVRFWTALSILITVVLAVLSSRPQGPLLARVGRACVPLVAAAVGFALPALGYLALIGGHPHGLSDWPWWSYICIPASVLFYGLLDTPEFAAVAFFNVLPWVSAVLAVSRLLRLFPPPPGQLAAA